MKRLLKFVAILAVGLILLGSLTAAATRNTSSLQGSKTSILFTNQLTLAALATEVSDARVQKVMINAAVQTATNLSPNDVADWFEDFLDGGADENTETT